MLKVFIAVAEKQNFTRAAEELHLSQPAVSQYVRSLEELLGAKLLERTSKYVKLTPAGKVAYDHARQIADLYTRMQTSVDDLMHMAGGPIAIGASYTFGEYVLPGLIGQLQKEYPKIEPSIMIGNTQEIAEAILDHRIDLGIVEGHLVKEDQLVMEPFAWDVMSVVVAAGHPFAERNEIEPKELEKERWILREPGSGTREAAERLFLELGIRPRKTMEFGSTQIIKESVEAGLGISLLSEHAVRKEQALGTIRMLRLEHTTLQREFFWVKREAEAERRAVEIFLEMIRKFGAK